MKQSKWRRRKPLVQLHTRRWIFHRCANRQQASIEWVFLLNPPASSFFK